MNQPLVEGQAVERVASLAKRWPHIIATAQDHKQKHAARRARQQAAKAPEA
jgi:hypothetical protein